MATPLAARAAPLLETDEPVSHRRLAALRDDLVTAWQLAVEEPPRLGAPHGRRQQRHNAARARRLIDDVSSRLADYPLDEASQGRWREEVKERLRSFGEEVLGWPSGYRGLVFDDAFFDSSRIFARRARAFDSEVEAADLLQALRNVWIVNSLQMLFGLPVALTPATFAYSMLYPYTDNLLDDPAIDVDAKRRFNDRLGRRLAGAALVPESRREADVYRLVEVIERQFPRLASAPVFDSLLAIHRGQEQSLRQQVVGRRPPSDSLLELSLEKGGASVLADAYLAAGTLAADQEAFSFGYGGFLQLLDDLQDAADDHRNQHWTLFSVDVDRRPLDATAARLHHFMTGVLDRFPPSRWGTGEDVADLIRRNCTVLFVGSIAEHSRLFTCPFRAAVERQWPFRLRDLRRLRRLGTRRFREAFEALRRRHGADLLDLLA